jgi:hypothetical protein
MDDIPRKAALQCVTKLSMNGVDDYNNTEYRACLNNKTFQLTKEKNFIKKVNNRSLLGGRTGRFRKNKRNMKKKRQTKRKYKRK